MSDLLHDPLEGYDFTELLEERNFRRCAPQTDDPEKLLDGFLYFCSNYWTIRHPEKGRIPFDLFEAQVETARCWINKRFTLILKARQIGFSTLVAAYAFWVCAFYSDRPTLMLSRTEREAIKLLGKAKYGYQFLPEWLKFRLGPVNQTLTRLEFTNNSYVESLPSASDPARGESAFLVVVDELAFLPNSEQAYGAIEPVADVGGRIILLSTANGEGNLFHRLWVEAQTGHNRYTPLFFPWSANGRDQDWYDAKRAELPDWQLAQEYPDNAEESFLRSGRPVFDLIRLREIETADPIFKGYLDERDQPVDDGGALHIWAMPEPRGRYVIGADPSQGMEHSDHGSVHVIHVQSGHVVAHWNGLIDADVMGTDLLARLGRFYRQALIGVESNNMGLVTLKALQRARYSPLYYERSPLYRQTKPTDRLGFRTDQVTKPLMIGELNAALRADGKLKLECAETLAELRTYVRKDRGKMEGSPFDDRVISLAIAVQMLKYAWVSEFQPKAIIEPGTVAWWEKKLNGSTFAEVIAGEQNRGKITRDRPPIGQNFTIRR
jgi:Terminase large subunit, T4likevirus-type, N-terminal